MDIKCCVLGCEQPATVFTEGLTLCPEHYIEMDREHKRLMFKEDTLAKLKSS